ncbi:hypothetical protein G6F63_014689 [Rhizopus arrhizus]|nr:hypothetical protein G6F63_014689 [Rhizopus arrhizus]
MRPDRRPLARAHHGDAAKRRQRQRQHRQHAAARRLGALPRRAGQADLPAEAVAQATHDRQAQAGAAVTAAGAAIGLAECFEDDLQLLAGNADAGIGDFEADAAAASSTNVQADLAVLGAGCRPPAGSAPAHRPRAATPGPSVGPSARRSRAGAARRCPPPPLRRPARHGRPRWVADPGWR